jgi:hypothetical protein
MKVSRKARTDRRVGSRMVQRLNAMLSGAAFTEQAAFQNSPDEGTQELDIWRDIIN